MDYKEKENRKTLSQIVNPEEKKFGDKVQKRANITRFLIILISAILITVCLTIIIIKFIRKG